MATTPENASPEATQDEAEGEERTRLPRVVVRMSQGMFDALKKHCETNDVLATALGRTLLAKEIGWDLAKDPDAPGSATRTRYGSDEERSAAKDTRKAYNRLLRKGLYQAHLAATHNRPALLEVAQATIKALSDKSLGLEAIQKLDTTLDEAIKAGA